MHLASTFLLTAVAISPVLALPVETSILEARDYDTPVLGGYTGETSKYPDGSGTYIGSKDQYTYRDGNFCWTDIFRVSYEEIPQKWIKSGDIDCATTLSCTSGNAATSQACQTWTLSETITIEASFLSIFSVSSATTFSYASQTCNSITTNNACTWNDQRCHATWSSQVNLVAHGYIRRKCDFFRNGVKDWTMWSHDFDAVVPGSTARWGCAAACNNTAYPGIVPPP